jgi:hypothetical protein
MLTGQNREANRKTESRLHGNHLRVSQQVGDDGAAVCKDLSADRLPTGLSSHTMAAMVWRQGML